MAYFPPPEPDRAGGSSWDKKLRSSLKKSRRVTPRKTNRGGWSVEAAREESDEGELERRARAHPRAPSGGEQLDVLRRAGAMVEPQLFQLGDIIHSHAPGVVMWRPGPMKQRARCEEKMAADYGGDPKRLLDIVRVSLVCSDLDAITGVVGFLRQVSQIGVKAASLRS